MNYSKAHQNFSNRLQKPEALTKPQDFLGPNYQTVLNFWWFMDSLTEGNWNEVARRYRAPDSAARNAARIAARDAAWDAARIAAGAAAGNAAGDAAGPAAWGAARYATWELIGKIENPLFLPLFDKLDD